MCSLSKLWPVGPEARNTDVFKVTRLIRVLDRNWGNLMGGMFAAHQK